MHYTKCINSKSTSLRDEIYLNTLDLGACQVYGGLVASESIIVTPTVTAVFKISTSSIIGVDISSEGGVVPPTCAELEDTLANLS